MAVAITRPAQSLRLGKEKPAKYLNLIIFQRRQRGRIRTVWPLHVCSLQPNVFAVHGGRGCGFFLHGARGYELEIRVWGTSGAHPLMAW